MSREKQISHEVLWKKWSSKRLTFRVTRLGVTIWSEVGSILQHTLKLRNFLFRFWTAYLLPEYSLTFFCSLPSRRRQEPSGSQEIWNWVPSILDKSRKLDETFSAAIELRRGLLHNPRKLRFPRKNCELSRDSFWRYWKNVPRRVNWFSIVLFWPSAIDWTLYSFEY